MSKKGFTLIELLAVIIVLAIILLIIIPKVIDAVNDSKKEALRMSAEAILKESLKLYINDNYNMSVTGKTYTITNKAFVGDELTISGELPDNGNIYINEEGQVALAIFKGNYCAYKNFADKGAIISETYSECVVTVPETVLDTCFTRTNDGVQVTITQYNTLCSKNVIIPSTLDTLPVRILGIASFEYLDITSVHIPNSVTTIGQEAFLSNQLSNLVIPESVTIIEDNAFIANSLVNVSIPSNVTIVDSSISNSFYDSYVTNNDREAGNYTAITQETVWSKQ